jgi:hypothetical protein
LIPKFQNVVLIIKGKLCIISKGMPEFDNPGNVPILKILDDIMDCE